MRKLLLDPTVIMLCTVIAIEVQQIVKLKRYLVAIEPWKEFDNDGRTRS